MKSWLMVEGFPLKLVKCHKMRETVMSVEHCLEFEENKGQPMFVRL